MSTLKDPAHPIWRIGLVLAVAIFMMVRTATNFDANEVETLIAIGGALLGQEVLLRGRKG